MSANDFFQRMMPHAQRVSARTGLDPRLVLAQAALETGYGKHAPDNNYFGIKSHGRKGGNSLQTQEFENGQMVTKAQSFRGYSDPGQSFDDYAAFLERNPRYKPVLSAGGLNEQIAAMGRAGYATDPNYASKLSKIAGMVDGDFTPSSQAIADGAMMAIGKQPVSQPVSQPSGGGDRVLVGGLLGDTMGADMAEYEPEKAGGLLGKVFPNMTANRRDEIKMALAGMSLNPNQALVRGIEGRMEGRREDEREFKTQQKAQAQANKTAAFIEAQVRAGKLPPELLEMARVDPASAYKAAVGVMTQQPKAATPYSDQAKIMSDLKNGLITREQANAALTGAGDDKPEYGLTPQYVTRPDGSLGLIQLGKDGSVNVVEMPEGMALQKGVEKLDLGTSFQWYNTVTGDAIGDPIPKDNRGAAAETAAGTVEGKDEATKAIEAPGVIAEAQTLESLIDSVITDPALPSVVGNVQGRLPAGTPLNGGQAGANVQAKIDQIGGKAFLQAFESLKGGGQITEREGAAAQAAMARMNQTQDQATFTASLRDLQAIARNARLRAQGQQVPEYTGAAPSGGSQPAPSYDPQTPDFSTMSDEELQAYIERGGQ